MIFLINCMSNKVFKSQSLFLLFAKPLDYMLFKKFSCLCYLIFIQIIPINFFIVHYNVFLLATKNLRKDICLVESISLGMSFLWDYISLSKSFSSFIYIIIPTLLQIDSHYCYFIGVLPYHYYIVKGRSFSPYDYFF